MDYEQMVAWALRIKIRCYNEGKTEDQTRSEIFNSALVQFSDAWDSIDDNTVYLAKCVVADVMPGAFTSAIVKAN